MTRRFGVSVVLSSVIVSLCYVLVSIRIENEFLASLLVCFSGMIILGWSSYSPVVDPNELFPWIHAVMTSSVIALVLIGFRPGAHLADRTVAWISVGIVSIIGGQIAREWHFPEIVIESSMKKLIVHRCLIGLLFMVQSIGMAVMVHVTRGWVDGLARLK